MVLSLQAKQSPFAYSTASLKIHKGTRHLSSFSPTQTHPIYPRRIPLSPFNGTVIVDRSRAGLAISQRKTLNISFPEPGPRRSYLLGRITNSLSLIGLTEELARKRVSSLLLPMKAAPQSERSGSQGHAFFQYMSLLKELSANSSVFIVSAKRCCSLSGLCVGRRPSQ